MAKKTLQPQDKYVLRMPDGLRERIKAYAEINGRSMNAEIIRVLEQNYPAPMNLSERLEDLRGVVDLLKKSVSSAGVEILSDEILKLVQSIASGNMPEVNEEDRREVAAVLEYWEERDGLEYGHRPVEDD